MEDKSPSYSGYNPLRESGLDKAFIGKEHHFSSLSLLDKQMCNVRDTQHWGRCQTLPRSLFTCTVG